MPTYFNLKVGKPDVMGVVLEVDMTKGMTERVKNLTDGSQPVYNGNYGNAKFIFDFEIEEGLVKLLLDEPEHLTITQTPKKCRIYFKQITEEEAKKNVKDALNWNLLVGYVNGL